MFIVPMSPMSQESRHLSRLFFGSEASAARSPALDVAESDGAYTVQLEVPGVAKQDVKVSVEGRRVTVSAQTQTQTPAQTSEAGTEEGKQESSDRIVYRERSAASYSRSFTLPVEVDQAEAGAKLENGVLTLTLPKRHARAAAQLTVN